MVPELAGAAFELMTEAASPPEGSEARADLIRRAEELLDAKRELVDGLRPFRDCIKESVAIPSRHVLRRCYHGRMGGSSSKRPRPSYEDGKLRDPRIEAMQKDAAKDGDDQRSGLVRLIRRAVRLPQAPSRSDGPS